MAVGNSLLNRVETYLNFLKFPSCVLFNVRPDKDGLVELKDLDLGVYSTLQIVTTNLFSTVTNIVPLPQNDIHFRDVTQMSNFKKD